MSRLVQLILFFTLSTFGFSNIVINEIHYNPSLHLGFEDADYEFIELYNNSDEDIDISHWSFSSANIHYQFDEYVLGARDYVLLCRNSHTYDGCIDHHGGSLLNDGDELILLDAHHNYIDYVSYDDGQDSHDTFPSDGDAEGPSIELIDPDFSNNYGNNWQASSQINGTPGYENSSGIEIEAVLVGFGTVGPEQIEITMDTPYDVAGFQMDITGVSLGEASGGLASDADFTVSTGSLSTIIGFSFTGGFIPAGSSGVLTNIEYVAQNEDACIVNLILSDPDGVSLNGNIGDCISLELTTCDDPEACNFGLDGECQYPEENFDCDGNCTVDIDCDGECGGGTVVDDCGVCGGNNADKDCNGDCFGDAVEDDCGECGGDSSSCTALLEFGNYCDMNVEILYSSFTDVAGFQFTISNINIAYTFGGLAEEFGFNVSNSENTVIGFSLEGNTIPTGQGVLTNIKLDGVNPTPECFEEIIMSDTNGNEIPSLAGDCADLWSDLWSDDGSCQLTDENLNYFTDLPNSTGLNHLVIIEDILGLEPGDEIGLFDANGLLSSEDCSDEYGELLVGAGVYDGSQMNIVGVGSLDFCDFPDGYQLSGWVEDNPIMIKIWDASQNYEYVATQYMFESGGVWNELFSTIMELDANIYGCTDPDAGNYNEYATIDDNSCVYIVTQQLEMDGVILNNISLNVQPGNPDVEALFSNHDVMFIANADGEFYIPENDVNTIGDWNLSKGYQVLLNGFDNQMLQVEGYPVDLDNTTITLNPFTLNNISFPLHQPISAADLVEGLPVIFCTDDQGHYYIPGTGFNTIDESGGMLPGKGYQVLIGGSETLEFTYSEPSSDNLGRNLAVVGASENYEITRTGVSHPMVINQITGTVSEGDELVAYANGIPVGVAPVDVDGSTLLVAWKSLYEYGLDTDGYQDGDDIEIRLFSQEYGQELRVMADLNVSTYGESPITMGSIHVLNELAVPVEFGLEQNYPNPFNPSTTIDVSVASDSYIMLNVYDINGRLISTLADDTFDTGYHSFVWNGLDQSGNKVSAGIYFYSLQTNEMTLTKKMILMK